MEKKITITKEELSKAFLNAINKLMEENKDLGDGIFRLAYLMIGVEINKELDKLLFEEPKEEPKTKMMKIKDIDRGFSKLGGKICSSHRTCETCPIKNSNGVCRFLLTDIHGEEEIDVSPYLKDGD